MAARKRSRKFSRSRARRTTQDRIDLDPLLVDLFHHWGDARRALDFLIEVVRRTHEDVNDELVQTLLPFGERAVEPLLKLYEELGEEQGSDIAFLLAGLRVHDPRVLALLLDRLQFDAGDGALCLELYHDPAARPALETMLAEIPAEEVELRRDLQHALEELDQPAACLRAHTVRHHGRVSRRASCRPSKF